MIFPYQRHKLTILLLVAILLLASSDVAFVVHKDDPIPRPAGRLQSTLANTQVRQRIQFFRRTLDDLKEIDSARQGDLASDGKPESDSNPSDGTGESDGNPSDGKSESDGNPSDEGKKEADAGQPDSGSDAADDKKDKGTEVSGTKGTEKGSSTDGDKTSSSDQGSDASAENAGTEDKAGLNGDKAKKGEDQSGSGTWEASIQDKPDPFNAFMLMQMKLTSDDGFEQVTIYEHGSFVGPFAGSPNTSSIDGLSDPNDEAWYTDPDYADRIAFQFTYTPDSKDYDITEPVVATGSSSGILPIVEDFKNDVATGGGSFTVLYRCQPESKQTSHVSLKLQVTANRSVETIWTKKCGYGRFDHVKFGFVAHDHEVKFFNADGTYGTDEQQTLEVGPYDQSTRLTMKLIPPAQNLQFSDPYIYSDSSDVRVKLRETITSGTLSSDTETSFSILYECETGTATIGFSLGIPPWDNVTAHWRKDCGGSSPKALLIGTSGRDSYDVMQHGELARKFDVTEQTTLDEAKGVVELIPANVDKQRFYLTNSDDTSDLHIQTITTTMSNPEVLTTMVDVPSIGSGSYIPAVGDVIKRKEAKTLSLRFLCKREGQSLVLVTLPTLRYKHIEFGFIKECYEPRAYHHSGFLQTASSLMAAFLVLGVLAAIGTCVYIRKRQGTKYTAVPTNDPVIP